MSKAKANGRTYVFRLLIEYPEGSMEPGWRPALWSNPEFLARLNRKAKRELARTEFHWPRERKFLTANSAWNRAWELQVLGCRVHILRSAPAVWPNVLSGEEPFAGSGITQNW